MTSSTTWDISASVNGRNIKMDSN